MNIKSNVMAVFRHQKPERIPWLTYDIPYPMLPRGAWERELRNKGLGLIGLMGFYPCGNVYISRMPNVEVIQKVSIENKRTIISTTYNTPVGSITKKEDFSISPPNPWIIEYPIKDVSDYRVVKFMVEDTMYETNYDAFYWADKHIGEDGFIRADCSTPFQNLLIRFTGYRRLLVDLYRHKEQVEDLLSIMEEKYFEVIRILAESPVEVIGIDGNVNGRITNPKLFAKYLLPLYQKASEILHSKGKIVSVHMDGALSPLKMLIPDTGIDVVEAFTPPPMGDLSVKEARNAWGDQIIIEANFPENVCLQGVDMIRKVTMDLLKQAAPGDGFILSVTEDIPYRAPNDVLEESLRAITDVMWEHGKYPIRI
ncbi:MAG: uroporphyrinogen decarboxylase family protein [Thermoproteota archaeon]